MNHKNPLVSIGVLSYNRQDVLPQAIESLLAQTYPNTEIIISDDASVDDSSAICQSYAAEHGNITVFVQKKNLGIPGNSNFVLKKARGKYFMWASNDDLWHKNYISELVGLLESNRNAILAVSNFYLFNDHKKQYANLHFHRLNSGISLLKDYLSIPSLLVWGIFRKKGLVDVGGFHTDHRFLWGGSDHVTVYKTLLKGDLMFISKNLFMKRDSGHGMEPFILLKQGLLLPHVLKKIARYLLYPIMFLIDFFWLVYFSLRSNFTLFQKCELVSYSLFYLLKTNFNYFRSIFHNVIRLF